MIDGINVLYAVVFFLLGTFFGRTLLGFIPGMGKKNG